MFNENRYIDLIYIKWDILEIKFINADTSINAIWIFLQELNYDMYINI